MIQTMQMLRIHLLELEKVHELCDSFRIKYLESMKTRLNNEMVPQTEGEVAMDSPDRLRPLHHGSISSQESCPISFTSSTDFLSAPSNFKHEKNENSRKDLERFIPFTPVQVFETLANIRTRKRKIPAATIANTTTVKICIYIVQYVYINRKIK